MMQYGNSFRRAFLMLGATALLGAGAALAADANKPHPHHGVLEPFTGAPPKVKLTPAQEARLAAGKSVQTQTRGKTGGRGMAIQDVHADVDTVWGRITDYANYPKMVEDLKEAEVYEKKGEHIKVRMVIGNFAMSVEYFIDHVFRPDKGYMTWTLDYSKLSDLDDSVGYWYVTPVPGKPGWTRVYYSVAVRLSGWIPGFVEDMIAKKGLTKATAWVKRESEKAQAEKNKKAGK